MLKQSVLALALGAFAAGAAFAKADGVQAVRLLEQLTGTIESVQSDRAAFELKVGEETRRVAVSEKTTFTLDGEKAEAREALKAGHRAKVEVQDGVAVSVAATSKR
jgi:hypothetical protein